MSYENRKHIRRPFGQAAGILRPDGTLICECTLRDVSAGGARLKLIIPQDGTAPEIAPEFILSLSRRGNVFRHCRTVWRRDDEIGVRFVRDPA